MGWKDAPLVAEPAWKSAPEVKAQRAPTHAPVEDAAVEEVVVEGKRKPEWSDLPSNIPRSAANLARNMIEPILHPIQTAKGVGELAGGVLQHVRDMSPKGMQGQAPRLNTRTSDAAKAALIARYGGLDALKRTVIEDPVGFAADASMVLGGGGAGIAKLGGTAGKVGRVLEATGKAIDPVAAVGKVAKAVPRGAGAIAAPLTGFTSITSPTIVRKAYEAGVKGGEAADAFKGQIRGTAPIENLVQEARQATTNLRDQRQAQYLADMAEAKSQGAAAPPIDFQPIENAIQSVRDRGVYKGKAINPSAAKAWNQIDEIVTDWKNSDPAEYHSVEGIDAMKRAIGNIKDGLEFGSPARNVANEVYGAVRQQLSNQAPSYAKAMEGYENASSLLEDLDKSLALNNKAATNSTIRSLMNALREDSSSGFGRNAKLAQTLENNGAENLSYMLSGRSLKPVLPQGLRGGLSASAAAYYGASGSPLVGVPTLLASSPRLVGETAHALGKASRPFKAASEAVGGAYNAVRPAPLVAAQSQNYLPEPTENPELNSLLNKYIGERAPPPVAEAPTEDSAEEPQASADEVYEPPYIAKIIKGHEGLGKNPESSAVGPFQFTKGTLAEMYNEEHPDDKITDDEADTMRADGRISTEDLERYGIKFTEANIQRVINAGQPVTVGNVYLMHFAGEGDGPKVLTADPNAMLRDVIDSDSMDANANIHTGDKYLKDFTVQDMRDWAEKSMYNSYADLKERGEIE